MARNEAGLKTALEKIPALRAEFWENVNVLGSEGSFNQNLERAGRVADFLEFAEVLTLDALHRKESCGGHFREESQTPEGEAKRDDENFCYVGAWEYKGDGVAPELSKEPLTFDNVIMSGLNLTLKIWRQKDAKTKGQFETVKINDVSPDMSFLEMLDIVNEEQMKQGKEGFAFDHDCREGICGMCSLVINGMPHGPDHATTTCQLHMRKFKDGDTIVIEPWRAAAFPVLRDCVVDRTAFDRIIQAGGFVSVNTGAAPEASTIPVPKADADRAFDAAACIGCGACVAACKNASAMLFVSAKVSHLSFLPQGKVEAKKRVLAMVAQMDKEGFGNCTNLYECQAACPKGITVDYIAKMNREYLGATVTYAEKVYGKD